MPGTYSTPTHQLLSIKTFCQRLEVTRSGLRALAAKDPTFPRPIKLGHSRQSSVRYRESDCAQWIETKMAEQWAAGEDANGLVRAPKEVSHES